MIELKNISKSFDDKQVISDFSYDFGEKGIICISGASGCGKTTLLRIISGLEKADSGEVSVNGKLTFLFQEDRLLPWLNVEENIACVLRGKAAEKHTRVENLLTAMGLEGLADAEISSLSGGMKRRVALARAIAPEPDILLLDEAFNGLDNETRFSIHAIIKEYSKEHLVVLVTHDESDISSLADKVIKL